MDPYRRFYEPNYIAPSLANPPQASRTGQRSLSPLIPTPASEEVTGYPPPLDWDNIIDDGPPLPGTPYYPYYSRTRNSHQHRTTSVMNPVLNGIASVARRHSPVSSYRTDCEYDEYPSQPPARDNPFYPPPLNDYRRPTYLKNQDTHLKGTEDRMLPRLPVLILGIITGDGLTDHAPTTLQPPPAELTNTWVTTVLKETLQPPREIELNRGRIV
ncbi:hypothetical protein HG530_013206 [Fusarium avenaceum]|nr:hypothetical protein HG530_013206 [Fusarium avenaceum]